MRILNRIHLAATILLVSASLAFAAGPEATAIPSPSAASAPSATPEPSAPVALVEADLVVFNRPVATFRGPFLGMSPATRVARAKSSLDELLRQSGELHVAVRENPEGFLIMLDDNLAFVMTAGDADRLRGETPEATAKATAARLETIVTETRESRNLKALTKSAILAGVATAIYAVALILLGRLRAWLSRRLVLIAELKARAIKVGGKQLVETHSFIPHLLRAVNFFRWLLVALCTYQWLSYVLSYFPYTRPWGEQLNQYLYNIIATLAEAMFEAFPGLGVALAIFLIARFFSGFSGRLVGRMVSDETPDTWLSPETAPTTRRLISIAIWLFAIAMAYPYLPGAQTEAFKGLSVLIGLMVSLGASSVVGQGAAGLILIYTRTIRKGEYVRIGDHEGTIVEMGMFTTRVRTGLGEELTIPNSLITGSVTKNYSRAVQGAGYIIDTTITIGYDTPWRQVEAMLLEAAKRTIGILETPEPRVFQTALSDFYPEYRLVAQAIPSAPRPRAEVLTTLHAHIQDVFNEYNVQIMSPHYMADPQHEKKVPKERWHDAPAQKPEDTGE